MERPVRLHLGAGDKHWPGWKNCDAETNLLDLEKGVKEIHAIHLFEHLPREQALSHLQHWYDVLESGGELVLEMPSMDKIAQMVVDGEEDPRLTLLGIFGDARYNDPLMLHRWCYTEKELSTLLTTCGFDVHFTEPVFHYAQRDLRVEAIKP